MTSIHLSKFSASPAPVEIQLRSEFNIVLVFYQESWENW